ncbi:MAG: hypothetical protein QOJ11_1717 [Frankiales bacterium]|jgi:hypothetical protein|nr:hypothetical protein [Frankiales bacterium]
MSILRRIHAALTNPGRVTFDDARGEVCDTACRASAQRQRTMTQVQNSLPIRLG